LPLFSEQEFNTLEVRRWNLLEIEVMTTNVCEWDCRLSRSDVKIPCIIICWEYYLLLLPIMLDAEIENYQCSEYRRENIL